MGKSVLKVGVIGCGAIGKQHIQRMMNKIPQTTVVAVADYFLDHAKQVAKEYGIAYYKTGKEVIHALEVDAVVITSNDESHAEYVLECLKVGKYVFCEKPLSLTANACIEMMKEEQKWGKRLVQVGFMRRYDKGYVEMKRLIEEREIGQPLMIHAAHRNVSQASGFQTDYAITRVAIHEIDICRWLLEDEYDMVQVLSVRQSTRTSGEWLNPQMIIMRTKSGQHIDVEVQTDQAYAYDIRCQVVGEDGVIDLPDPPMVVKRKNANCSFGMSTDWSQRFIEAYDVELENWATDVLNDRLTGPSTWDGYVSCVTSDALIKSRKTGVAQKVDLVEKPSIYLL